MSAKPTATKGALKTKKPEPGTPSYLGLAHLEDGWWWSARAANHKEVASSGEGYSNRGAAVRMGRLLFPGLPIVPV
jgi:hypothetical protein